MSGLTITTAPANEPLDAAETISYLRIDSGVDTTLIDNLIQAARFWAEDYTNRTFLTTTFTLSLDAIGEVDVPLKEGFHTGYSETPRVNYIELPRSPVQSVTSIKSFADDNTKPRLQRQTIWLTQLGSQQGVVLRDGGTWPTDLRNANGIEVLYVAGYGDSRATIPEPIRVAMLEYIAFLYEHRGDDEGRALNPPMMIRSLLQPYVIMRYGVSPFNGGMAVGYR